MKIQSKWSGLTRLRKATKRQVSATRVVALALLALPTFNLQLATVQAQSVQPISSLPQDPFIPDTSNGLTLGQDGNFYGTTSEGGILSISEGGNGIIGNGTVFEVSTDGFFNMLHEFSPVILDFSTSFTGFYTNADGAIPEAALTLGPDGNLYGTASQGGTNGLGTLFEITTNGVLTTLVSFVGSTDGEYPEAGLTLGTDGNFYGTTPVGGSGDSGTVFRVTTNGVLTILHSFTQAINNGNDVYTNSDGARVFEALTLVPDGNLYGMTGMGGSNGWGTLFEITTNGVFTTVASSGTNGDPPSTSLTLGPDGNFYGVSTMGGNNNWGAVVQVRTNGVLTTLISFGLTNGGLPEAALTLGPDGNFYGTTTTGGPGNWGTLFKVTTNGTLTSLYSFTGGDDGAYPAGGLTLGPDGNFYGTTSESDNGKLGVYRLDLPPEIIQQPTNQSAVSGSAVTYSTTLFGTTPYSFQWLSNNIAIAGATNNTLTIQNVNAADDAGGYSIVVTNAWGSITSSVADLIIGYAPTITNQPQSVIVANGAPVTFTVWAIGTTPLAYQWQFNGTNLMDNGNISGSATSNLAISAASITNGGNYTVIVTNSYGSATSSVAVLTVVVLEYTVLEYTAVDLGTLGGPYSDAYAINNSGQVAGYADTSSGYNHAFLYSGGTMTDLGTLGGSDSGANAINSSGQVVGYADTSSGSHAFLYSGGTMTDLGTPGGPYSDAYAINNSGQVVGYAETSSGYNHAFLYSGGTMMDLGTLGGSYSYANAINNSGQVVGNAETSSGYNHAFLYSGGTMTDLGTLDGAEGDANAYAINNSGQVVGEATTSSGGDDAFLYSGGTMFDLNSMINTNGIGTTIYSADLINDSGSIVAQGNNNHAYLLTPADGSLTGSAGFAPKVLMAAMTHANFTFSWPSLTAYPPIGYQIQYTTNLMSPWTNIGSVITNGITSFTTPVGTNSQGFYRVQLVQ